MGNAIENGSNAAESSSSSGERESSSDGSSGNKPQPSSSSSQRQFGIVIKRSEEERLFRYAHDGEIKKLEMLLMTQVVPPTSGGGGGDGNGVVVMKKDLEAFNKARKRLLLEREDVTGRTALVVAIISGESNKRSLNKTNTVRALLENGADVHHVCRKARKWTALHFACSIGDLDVIKLLLKFGANPDAQDSVCLTPLDVVSSRSASVAFLRHTAVVSEKTTPSRSLSPRASTPIKNVKGRSLSPRTERHVQKKHTSGPNKLVVKTDSEEDSLQGLKEDVSPLSRVQARYAPKASIFGRCPASLLQSVESLVSAICLNRSVNSSKNSFRVEMLPYVEKGKESTPYQKWQTETSMVRKGDTLAVNFQIPSKHLGRFCVQLFIIGEKPWLMKPLLGRFQFIPSNTFEGTYLMESEALEPGRGYRAVLIDENENILAASRLVGVVAEEFELDSFMNLESAVELNNTKIEEDQILDDKEEKDPLADSDSTRGRRLVSRGSSRDTLIITADDDAATNDIDIFADTTKEHLSQSASPGLRSAVAQRKIERRLSRKRVSFDSESSYGSGYASGSSTPQPFATRESLLKALSLSANFNSPGGESTKSGNDEGDFTRTPSPGEHQMKELELAAGHGDQISENNSDQKRSQPLRKWMSDTPDLPVGSIRRLAKYSSAGSNAKSGPQRLRVLSKELIEEAETLTQDLRQEDGEEKIGAAEAKIDDNEPLLTHQTGRHHHHVRGFRDSQLSSISEHSLEELTSSPQERRGVTNLFSASRGTESSATSYDLL